MAAISIPDGGRQLAVIDGWTLYELRPTAASFLWPRLKLVCPPGTRKKAGRPRVYTLNWSPLEARFSRGGARWRLEHCEFDLYLQVVAWLTQNLNREWLALHSPEEIQAEQDRLAARREAWRAMSDEEKEAAKEAAAIKRAVARREALKRRKA